MDEDCVEVIDLAGPENVAIIQCETENKNIKSDEKFTSNKDIAIVDYNQSELINDIQSSVSNDKNKNLPNQKTKKRCRHRKNTKNTSKMHDEKDKESIQISSYKNIKSLEKTDVQSSYIKKKKKCSRKKHKKSTQDDDSVILIMDSSPQTINAKSDIDKQKKTNDIFDKQYLITLQDVEIKCNSNSKLSAKTVALTNKNQHMLLNSVPKERILPYCFRKMCCNHSGNAQNRICRIRTKHQSRRRHSKDRHTKNSQRKKEMWETRKSTRQTQKSSIPGKTATNKLSDLSSDFLYEDISQGSFESKEEIDVLIKRAKKRECKITMSTIKTSKPIPSTSPNGFSDFSDVEFDSDLSWDSKVASNNFEDTIVLKECMYTSTSFSPNEGDFKRTITSIKEPDLMPTDSYSPVFSDFSDIVFSEYSRSSKAASIHSKETLVLGEPIFTPTRFTPLHETECDDCVSTKYEEDMSLDSDLSLPL